VPLVLVPLVPVLLVPVPLPPVPALEDWVMLPEPHAETSARGTAATSAMRALRTETSRVKCASMRETRGAQQEARVHFAGMAATK
jgi:hypothetical protein